MKANELRIGNWVIGKNGEHLCVQELSNTEPNGILRATVKEHYFETWFGYGLGEVSGILLTHEILEKCGFITTMNSQMGYKQLGRIINGHDFTFVTEYNYKPEFFFDMVGTEIIFLHQLQNLYWCLVGEELTINP